MHLNIRLATFLQKHRQSGGLNMKLQNRNIPTVNMQRKDSPSAGFWRKRPLECAFIIRASAAGRCLLFLLLSQFPRKQCIQRTKILFLLLYISISCSLSAGVKFMPLLTATVAFTA